MIIIKILLFFFVRENMHCAIDWTPADGKKEAEKEHLEARFHEDVQAKSSQLERGGNHSSQRCTLAKTTYCPLFCKGLEELCAKCLYSVFLFPFAKTQFITRT